MVNCPRSGFILPQSVMLADLCDNHWQLPITYLRETERKLRLAPFCARHLAFSLWQKSFRLLQMYTYTFIVLGQIGADRAAFGSFGTNIALLVDFYIPDKTAWYAKVGKYRFCCWP